MTMRLDRSEHRRTTVLVIEDEESYREALASGLDGEGFDVSLAIDGFEGLRLITEQQPDIVLLDMLLPGMNGIDVCRKIRAISSVPVIMVSAVDSELDVVLGLELGASGYVTKPFRLRELVARMNAILRRVQPDPSQVDGGLTDPIGRTGTVSTVAPRSGPVFGAVAVDYVRREVTLSGAPVHLSRKEFDLLAALLTPVQRVRSRGELIELLWPDTDLADTRTLDTHIHRLRTKLEPAPAEPRYIVTVRGIGFRIDPGGDAGVSPPTGGRVHNAQDAPISA